MSKEEEQTSGKKFAKWSVWSIVGGVICILVVIRILYPEFKFTELNIFGFLELKSKPVISEKELKQIPKEELAQRQEEIKKELEQKEKELQQREELLQRKTEEEEMAEIEQHPEIQDISGYWRDDIGLSYSIGQEGNNISIQQIHPVYGVISAGYGVIIEKNIDISYNTITNTTGKLFLTISADGQRLTGSWKDLTTGVGGQSNLYR